MCGSDGVSGGQLLGGGERRAQGLEMTFSPFSTCLPVTLSLYLTHFSTWNGAETRGSKQVAVCKGGGLKYLKIREIHGSTDVVVLAPQVALAR